MGAASSFDIRQILERLPHRQPILLVDRVVEVEPMARLVAVKNVTYNEDFFRGHFPGNPIMPGVLIVEAMAQAAGLLVSASTDSLSTRPYLVGLDGVKFRRPVTPGDRLLIEVELLNQRRSFWRFRSEASVEGDRATEATVLLSVDEGGAGAGGDPSRSEMAAP